ncbi:RECEPTOR-LIKE PROTEIN 14 [Salix purpurea]|uniref:RECEPTOR-LIKE PROTEIN 14 n=1 Tax=Salix purpurea TaxID=77065 RepID=A0A9Q0WXZ8_SALPP|nr:RECEPTOR-LIKE PROTEIN 14 [Salix purpurea]
MALAFVNDRCHCCLQEERSGLLEIKAWFSHAGGAASTFWLQGWDKDDLNCCNWDYRVLCDSTTNRVIKLDLLSVNDDALEDLYLNASLFLPFKELEILDLRWNQLVGGLKNQGLRKLEVLYLESSDFKENILLESLGGLPSLKTLYARESIFNGKHFGKGWCELKNLERLYLGQNNLKGVLPPCLGNLSSLRYLDLSYNQFEGNIAFSHLSHLPQLEKLSISNNHFQVPISFGSFMNHSNLKYIACDNNELVPGSSFQAPAPKLQLRFLSASSCTSKLLIAEFPTFLHTQYDLVVVDLSHNKFVGEPFPSWLFENNTKLKRLYLRNTSFIGPLQLPQNPRPNLHTIDLSDNNIHGQVARNTCLIFPRLKYFIMANNNLTGCIPLCFGNMSSLAYLDLSNNHMSCELLEHNLATIGSSFWYLKLSNNNFKGLLPPSVFNMTELVYLFLDGNKFVGEVPGTFAPTLQIVDISNNLLSGMLPRGIGNSSIYPVEGIDLSKNHFEDDKSLVVDSDWSEEFDDEGYVLLCFVLSCYVVLSNQSILGFL